MTFRWRGALAAIVSLVPAVSWGQAVQSGKDATTSTIEKGRLGGSATFGNDVGIGTFVRNDFSDDPYFAQSLRLVPTYGLFKDISAQADGKITWEYTAPSDAGAGPAGRHYVLEDIILRLVHSSLYRDSRVTGVNVSGAFSAALPVSHDSRWRNYITKLTATLGLDRTFIERLTVTYAFATTKYLPTRTMAGDEDEELCTGTDCPPRGRINPNWAFRNTFGAGYQFTDKFSASMTLRFSTFLKFKVGDGATEPASEVNNPGTHERYNYTYSLGDVSASYRITDRYSVAGGVVSEQLVIGPRGGLRNPVFDASTSRENYTTIYVNGTATF